MSLPNTDPSLSSNPAPLFQDNSFVRGDQMRANNQSIWGNLEYLDTSKALLAGSATQDFSTKKLTVNDTSQATALGTGASINLGGASIAKNLYVGGAGFFSGSMNIGGNLTITASSSNVLLKPTGNFSGVYYYDSAGKNRLIQRMRTDTNLIQFVLNDATETLMYNSMQIDMTTGYIQFAPRLGIGVAPSYSFDVNGDGRFTGNVGIGGAPHATYDLQVYGTSYLVGNTLCQNQVGIGLTPGAGYDLRVAGDAQYQANIDITGNVGIGGTHHAAYDLQVNGQSNFIGGIVSPGVLTVTSTGYIGLNTFGTNYINKLVLQDDTNRTASYNYPTTLPLGTYLVIFNGLTNSANSQYIYMKQGDYTSGITKGSLGSSSGGNLYSGSMGIISSSGSGTPFSFELVTTAGSPTLYAFTVIRIA